MVSIDIFEGSSKNQFLRTLIAIIILGLSDGFYYKITKGMYGGTQFKDGFPWLPYITLWITVGSVLGVCEIKKTSGEKLHDSDAITMAGDATQFGVVIALIIYGPLIAFVYHPNGSPFIALMNFGFAIIICAITSLLVNIFSQEHSLYG